MESYGFVEQTGGVVKLMKSSYSIKLQDNRPPIASFPEGIFVNDYEYKEVKDQSYLDENNGRFCVTPEYPNGTYAYFATIDPVSSDTSGNFAQYRRPQFPYLIGDGYTSVPNKFNFKSLSCQKEYEFRNTTWLRNIDPYNLMDDKLKYEYLTIPNDLKQVTDVKAIELVLLKQSELKLEDNLIELVMKLFLIIQRLKELVQIFEYLEF